jgi:hypothetical protein
VPDEKFNANDLEKACNDLAMLQYFPHDARASVMALLAKMVPHKRALRWLVSQLVNHVGSWPGPAEVRGLLCTRFDPADGIDQWCSLPGFTAEEQEAKHLDRHQQLKQEGGYLADESRELIDELQSGVKGLIQ